mmetsp:Transcript_24499/g.45301  ORF Transcript_24499/g.45301 Transcript_24499/m.45301 type:complete len:270 (+) Transcript_24499:965-1774(+)
MVPFAVQNGTAGREYRSQSRLGYVVAIPKRKANHPDIAIDVSNVYVEGLRKSSNSHVRVAALSVLQFDPEGHGETVGRGRVADSVDMGVRGDDDVPTGRRKVPRARSLRRHVAPAREQRRERPVRQSATRPTGQVDDRVRPEPRGRIHGIMQEEGIRRQNIVVARFNRGSGGRGRGPFRGRRVRGRSGREGRRFGRRRRNVHYLVGRHSPAASVVLQVDVVDASIWQADVKHPAAVRQRCPRRRRERFALPEGEEHDDKVGRHGADFES